MPDIERKVANDDRLDNKPMSVLVSFDWRDMRDPAAQSYRIHEAGEKLRNALKKNMPACYGCESTKMGQVEQLRHDDMSKQTVVTAACAHATCRKRVSYTRRDGNDAWEFASLKLTEAEERAAYLGHMDGRDVTTKPRNPDVPQTAVDAW